MHRPTLQDVARAAGLSYATVDRVLNDRGGVAQKSIRPSIPRRRMARQILAMASAPAPLRQAVPHPYSQDYDEKRLRTENLDDVRQCR